MTAVYLNNLLIKYLRVQSVCWNYIYKKLTILDINIYLFKLIEYKIIKRVLGQSLLYRYFCIQDLRALAYIIVVVDFWQKTKQTKKKHLIFLDFV